MMGSTRQIMPLRVKAFQLVAAENGDKQAEKRGIAGEIAQITQLLNWHASTSARYRQGCRQRSACELNHDAQSYPLNLAAQRVRRLKLLRQNCGETMYAYCQREASAGKYTIERKVTFHRHDKTAKRLVNSTVLGFYSAQSGDS